MAATSSGGKIKFIAIIASLAALALILSPVFSLLQFPGAIANKNAGANKLLQDNVIEQDSTVADKVSDQDLAACTSVNKRVDRILGVVNGTVNDRKLASDTLIAEFCSRPTLIHEIMSADSASLSLVAYACDASSGKIGTAAIQDSLSDHKEIYCDSARKLIVNETNTFMKSVEEFRTKFLPLMQAGDNETETNNNNTPSSVNNAASNGPAPYFNATSVERTLDEVTQSLNGCLSLVDASEYYEAAKSFDNASKKFMLLFRQ